MTFLELFKELESREKNSAGEIECSAEEYWEYYEFLVPLEKMRKKLMVKDTPLVIKKIQ